MKTSTAVAFVLLSTTISGCGDEQPSGMQQPPMVEPITDVAAEAASCEDWPDCPDDIVTFAGGTFVLVSYQHFQCSTFTVPSSDPGAPDLVVARRICGECKRTTTCEPFVGRCRARTFRHEGPSGQCMRGDEVLRANGEPRYVLCTGTEMGAEICWDQHPDPSRTDPNRP